MARIGDKNQVIIDNLDELLREVRTMIKYTSINIIGPSGTGKTTFAERLQELAPELNIYKTIVFRLQGVGSEDFRIPIVKDVIKTKTVGPLEGGSLFDRKEVTEVKLNEKTVELVNMGIFQEILDNPDKNYLLLLDEVTRCDASVAPLLFGLFERRINGVPAPNMYVLSACNLGGDYIQNIDFSDSALRRRQIFIEYVPTKKDIVEYAQENEYNDIVLEVMEALDGGDLVSHEKASKELEQDTTLGSWRMLSNRWNDLKIKDYSSAKIDITKFGAYMFNKPTCASILKQITLFEQINQIDLHDQIIIKHNLDPDKQLLDRKGNVFDKTDKLMELKIRTKTFIVNEALKDNKLKYLDENLENILTVFYKDRMLAISIFKEIKNKINFIKKKNSKKSSDMMLEFSKIIGKVSRGKKESEHKEIYETIYNDLVKFQ